MRNLAKDRNMVVEFMIDYNNHRDAVKYFMRKLDGLKHISLQDYIQLRQRALKHDRSKEYDYDEFIGYVSMTSELKDLEYGTPEHSAVIEKYRYVVDLHYKNNDHHPEHFENGIEDMNKVQIIEMVCDWLGAMKSRGGLDNFEKSMEFNKKKFNITDAKYKEIYDLATYLIKDEI